MKKKNIFIYLSLSLLIISLIVNYQLYQENREFKSRIGSNYQSIVRNTLFKLDSYSSIDWEETLHQEDGKVFLAQYTNRFNTFQKEYSYIPGLPMLDTVFPAIVYDVYYLEKAINNYEKTDDLVDDMNTNMLFCQNVLTDLEDEFGEDSIKWYKELSSSNSETAKRFLERYNEELIRGK